MAAAAKVLLEWTHLLSGDRGAAVVQRLQDRLGGDSLDQDADSDGDDGRNFYEDLTGGQEITAFERPSSSTLLFSRSQL